MERYAVLERGEGLTAALSERLGPPCAPEEGPELLIVSPRAGRGTLQRELTCGTVLLPGSAIPLLEGIRARSAVSYGLSGRDTVTLSSREGGRMCVAVQRELVRLDGRVLERQELVVDVGPEADSLTALALTGAELLLALRD